MTDSKRFKRLSTILEQLPNELFVEISKYLTGVDAICAFSQLNLRFHSLLAEYVRRFDFQSISKAKFDHVTRNSDIHQWQSLRLSDDDQTPGQIKLFCKLYPPEQSISHLQSFSAVNMTYTYSTEFLSQSISFDHLVSLEIGKVCGEKMKPLQLPSLKRLVVVGCPNNEWLKNIPSLENLDYSIQYDCSHNHSFILPVTLKQLKLNYDDGGQGTLIRNVLRQLSQLKKLVLYDVRGGYNRPLPDGAVWQEFIQSSLPLLETFQFCFHFRIYPTYPSSNIQQVVSSFSTPFYLLEKRWFSQCDYDDSYSIEGMIYSLPYVFAEMSIDIKSFDNSTSTLPAAHVDEAKYDSYAKVKTLLFNEKCLHPYRSFLKSDITRLILKTPLPASWLFLLNNLRHLELQKNRYITSDAFLSLLENTPHLQSLALPIQTLHKITDKFAHNQVCDLLSQRILSLTIFQYYSDGSNLGVVSVRCLTSLARIFGRTCQHLSLALSAHPNTVLPILRRMQQLRSLHIRYRPWCLASGSNESVLSWLEQPPITMDPSDFVHVPNEYNFFVWFGNRL